MSHRLTPAVIVTAACMLSGCADPNNAEPPPAARNGRPAVAVTVQAVAPVDLSESVDVVGSLEPKFSADVKSEVSGVVSEVYVTQWVPVSRGARLARLDTSETDAALDALKALEAQTRVTEVRARREHERAVQLKQYGLITQQAFDEATSALEAAEAATIAARAQVRTGEARRAKSSIVAPMDGVVAERNVSVGDRVENMGSSASMFRIVDNRLLDLTVTVPSPHLAAIRVGQRLEFTTDAAPGRTFTGKVMFINPAVDPVSRSAKVIAEVPNPDGALKGGLFVRGRILTATRTGVIAVPREALLNWDVAKQAADVFVVQERTAVKRAVKTGAVPGPTVEITAGLAAGERIVTRGAFALRDGDTVALSSGHGS